MLYNKHRPAKFKEVVGHGAVISILTTQLRTRKLGHAYIFGGPSGVGKTTMARILASALVCGKLRAGNPCGKCTDCANVQRAQHWDVIEMDAASQRGIDDVRELVSKAYLSPFGKRKVYIVDEAHGLTPQAWDALLKSVEEPPDHLVWIFCTTKPELLPDTVSSRCQRYPLRPLSTKDLAEALRRVVASERVEIGNAGLTFIAETSEGNLRQALTTLEQVMNANGDRLGFKAVRKTVQALMPF